MTAAELVAAYSTGGLSPLEVLQAVLDHAHASQPDVNAFREIDVDGSLAAATASERRWRAGAPRGPLDGVPVSVKDMIATRGMATRFGSRTLPANHLIDVDAPAVAALREAGAIIFGKTTTSEFGHKIVTDSPLTGCTRNPWDRTLTSGGSSGGAGAALALGIGPLALGTDGGGSIRIPACWNGVFGFKPSFKRVPTAAGDDPTRLSNIGPMSRSVDDAALMLQVLCGARHDDWEIAPHAPLHWRDGLQDGVQGLRIAFSPDLGLTKVDDEIASSVAAAASVFEDLGAHVDIVDRPPPLHGYMSSRMHSIQWMCRVSHTVRAAAPHQRSEFDPDLLELADIAHCLPASALTDALQARHELAWGMHRFFHRYDLLLTPAFHRHPPPVPGLPADLRCAPPLTSWCNQTMQPAASIPCGRSAKGLPIGLQVVAQRYRDDLVLRACHAYEEARGRFPCAPLASAQRLGA